MKTSTIGYGLISLLVVAVFTSAALAQDTDQQSFSFEFEGHQRTYSLHIPDDVQGAAPLVFVLHGRGGTGEQMRAYTGFDAVADEAGFVVAYPDGINGEWNYVRGIPGYPNTHDDTAFLAALTDEIALTQPVDLSRVYITGFSNGGFMAQRAACDDPARFAAFASVGAAGFGGMPRICPAIGEIPSPMLLMHGTDDRIVPWDGESVTRGDQTVFITYPVPETFGFWAAHNGCAANAETTDLLQLGLSPQTSVRTLEVDCPENASVVLYAIIGGGHNWPGQPDGIPAQIAGNVSLDIDASRVIWAFFEPHHSAPPEPETTPEAAG